MWISDRQCVYFWHEQVSMLQETLLTLKTLLLFFQNSSSTGHPVLLFAK
jgi:hypothetical protein